MVKKIISGVRAENFEDFSGEKIISGVWPAKPAENFEDFSGENDHFGGTGRKF